MRYTFYLLITIALLGASCKKDSHPIFRDPLAHIEFDGTYTGTFQRININYPVTWPAGDTVNVTLRFADGKWEGEGGRAGYPALCRGTYNNIRYDSINFTNECAWYANFDWTLILSGHYKIQRRWDSIEIRKLYEAGHEDVYKLAKQFN